MFLDRFLGGWLIQNGFLPTSKFPDVLVRIGPPTPVFLKRVQFSEFLGISTPYKTNMNRTKRLQIFFETI